MSTHIRTLLKTPLSFRAIYEMKNVPMILVLTLFMSLHIGVAFPFAFGMLKVEGIDVERFLTTESIEILRETDGLDFLRARVIEEGVLVTSLEESLYEVEFGEYSILWDENDSYDPSQAQPILRLTPTYMEVRFGLTLIATYDYFTQDDLSSYDSVAILNDFVRNALLSTINQWFVPMLMFFCVVFIAIDGIFVLLISGVALLFRIGDYEKLSYGSYLKVIIGATVFPTILSVLIGVFYGAYGLNMFIYSFGTFGILVWTRRKYLKPRPKISED